MATRLSALFLVLLIALPFTAPFSVCDVATMLKAPAPHATDASLASAHTDAGTISPVVMMEEDHHACDLETPAATVTFVTSAATVACAIPAQDVIRTTPLALRL